VTRPGRAPGRPRWHGRAGDRHHAFAAAGFNATSASARILAAGGARLITNDSDILEHRDRIDIEIMTPSEFLQRETPP
jgi:hypothetical protein